MGCSSSALSKAGDSSRLRSEESESCFIHPKPCTLGRESIYENLHALQKVKISAMSTANGVKSFHEQPLAKDAADPSGSTEKIQSLEGPKEVGPLQPGGKDDDPGAEERRDVEAWTEAQPLESVETEPLETEAKHKPLRTTGERDSTRVVEIPQTAREMKPLRIAEKIPTLKAGRELQPQKAMGKPQLLETAPKETESPDIMGGNQLAETAVPHQLQEMLGRDKQSQSVETMPNGKGFLEMLEGSQLVETVVKNDLIHKIPEGPGNMEQIQPEGIVGSVEHPVGILETGTNMEMVRKTHTNRTNRNIEGETGEKVETEMEKESEGTETKEEETGGAVDLSTAI